ncbi:MAG: polysaccharide deacetylase family protein [Cytophagaceae bacterium]
MYFNNIEWILSGIYPSLVWSVKNTDKTLFLTFDDGPIPGVTDYVLEELKNFNAKATFFCVGHNIEKHPEVYRKIIQAGHRTGNHTYNHLNGWKTRNEEYFQNIESCRKIMDAENGSSPITNDQSPIRLFRPPYGKIKRRQIPVLADHYKIVMWGVLSGDFDKNLSAEKCLRKTIRYSRSGSIIVFHDSLKAEKNLRYVLPRYLQHFSELGYKFEAL